MKSRLQIAELAALLASRKTDLTKEGWSQFRTAQDTLLICRVAASAETIAVQLCNGVISQELFEHKQGKLLAKIKPLQEPYKVRFEIGGDPRGCVLKMFNAGGAPIHGNTLGGDESGYGI